MTKRFRILSTLFVLFYAVAFIGAAFHSHANGAEELQCKLCHVSNTAVILTAAVHCTPQASIFHSSIINVPSVVISSLATTLNGRAPPIA